MRTAPGVWSAFGDWLDAADPGALRRRHALRTALASLTAWLSVRVAVMLLADQPMPSVGLFAVMACFITALVVIDAGRAERRLTLALSLMMFVLALLLASIITGLSWVYAVVLLALIFASYAMRRQGLRSGELALVLTMGFYFAGGLRVSWNNLAWFALAAILGVASLWIWQFILLPYDPERSLRDSIRSFYDRAGSVVGAVIVVLDEQTPKVEATDARDKDLEHRLRLVRLSRRVIEDQFPGVLAPGGWTEGDIGRLQVALFTCEHGLAQIIEGAGNRLHLAGIPAEILVPIRRSMMALQQALSSGSTESMQTLAEESAALQTQVRAYAQRANDEDGDDTDTPPAPWVVAGFRLVGGGYRVAQSVDQVRVLVAHQGATTSPPSRISSSGRNNAASAAPVHVFGDIHLHPLTVLGLQAVLATGLAMVVARLLDIDHSNWVFWTAFVVIAGSTGESLRKMMMRVLGTVAGAAAGVALALLTPDNTIFVVIIATACIFLTIFSWPISYPQMVFWLNIGFVMVYTLLGAKEFDLLIARPLTAFVGALVAAFVVVYIFPIRTTSRFKVAVAHFLAAVDAYIAAFVATMSEGNDAQSLKVVQAQVAASYTQVERTLPGVAFENNPLLQAQSPLAHRATQIAALDAEVTRLATTVDERAGLMGDAGGVLWMRSIQAGIHEDIQTLVSHLTPVSVKTLRAAGDGREVASMSPERTQKQTQTRLVEHLRTGPAPGPFRTSSELALLRIQTLIAQLAVDLHAPAGEYPG